MPSKSPEELLQENETKREKFLLESMEEANAWPGKYGYFGFAGPLAIGDDSLAPKAKRKVVEDDGGEPPKLTIVTNPGKKGSSQDVYFSFAPPLALGDPFIDPGQRLKTKTITKNDPEGANFVPAGIRGAPGNGINKLGYEYVDHKDTFRDPLAMAEKYRNYEFKRQILTNPSSKGGGGVLTRGVLFGFSRGLEPTEQRLFPEHVPDPFDNAREIRKKEMAEHRSKLQEFAFKGIDHGYRHFQSNRECYDNNGVPVGIPREPKEWNIKIVEHEAKFCPPAKPKKGYNATIGKFPEWIEDPEPKPKGRVPKADDAPPAWRPGNPRDVDNPTKSVTSMVMNLRRERPSAFMRPTLGRGGMSGPL